MTTKRVRVRSLRGGTSQQRNDELCQAVFSEGINFSKSIPASNDTFVIVCKDDSDVDNLISEKTIMKLKKKDFDLNIPPQLRAKKTIIIKGLDKRVSTNNDEDTLLKEIESRNEWATVEQVVKFPNIPYMLKVRFTDISMAKKAIDQGIKILWFSIPSHQVEEENFIPITPCWNCYHYDHTVKDCPNKETMFCSE